MNRKTRWFLVNGLFLTMLALGVCGVVGAWYVTCFVIAIIGMLGLLVLLAYSELPDAGIKSGIPYWWDVSFDILVTGILVWNGHFLIGAVYLLANLIMARKIGWA